MFPDNKERALAETYRVLKPGERERVGERASERYRGERVLYVFVCVCVC